MPAACAIENGKRMVIDTGYEIDPVVAEQMKTSYVDDGLGRGTDELINRMVGDQIEIDGELFTNGIVSQILAKGSLRTKAMVRSGETNQLAMKKFGSQMLGHTWDPTLDEISF